MNPVHTAAKYSCWRFWNCTRPSYTFPYKTKKYPRHEVCILFYRNVEVLFVLMCFLLALVNGYVLSANRPEFLLTDGKCILQSSLRRQNQHPLWNTR